MSQGWALEKLLLWFRWSPTEEKKISPRKASHHTVPLPETTVRSDLRNRLRPLEISDGSVPQSRCLPEMHKLTRLPAADANLANDRRPSTGGTLFFSFEITMDIRWLSLLKRRLSRLIVPVHLIRSKACDDLWNLALSVQCCRHQLLLASGELRLSSEGKNGLNPFQGFSETYSVNMSFSLSRMHTDEWRGWAQSVQWKHYQTGPGVGSMLTSIAPSNGSPWSLS